MNTSDTARAARMVAAAAADDSDSVAVVLAEATAQDRMSELAMALSAHVVQIAGEFYDTDCQHILDRFALQAMSLAESDGG